MFSRHDPSAARTRYRERSYTIREARSNHRRSPPLHKRSGRDPNSPSRHSRAPTSSPRTVSVMRTAPRRTAHVRHRWPGRRRRRGVRAPGPGSAGNERPTARGRHAAVHADWWRERACSTRAADLPGDRRLRGTGGRRHRSRRGYVGLLARRIRHRSRMSDPRGEPERLGIDDVGAKQDSSRSSATIHAGRVHGVDRGERHRRLPPGQVRAQHPARSTGPCRRTRSSPSCRACSCRTGSARSRSPTRSCTASRGEFGLDGGPAARHHEARRAAPDFFNSYGDLFHPNDRGYEIWASAFEPAVDARVDTVAAIRHYLSRSRGRGPRSEAGAVASARAEQDTEHAEELEHGERPVGSSACANA